MTPTRRFPFFDHPSAWALLLLALLLPRLAGAQDATPPPIIPAAPAVPAAPAPVPAVTPLPAPVDLKKATASGIVMNFQGASLTDVLNYLSEAAGFVIVQETPVTGTVNVVSRQPISADEAVDLVNTVLVEKGFVAIRNGRILKIVTRASAKTRDLPVMMGSDPAGIPRKDDMVTQILPLRFGEAAKVIENLRPLLSETATMTANESSNAILLTDTQTNIHRVAEIIKALDTSVSSISSITVFPLKFADAKQVAETITQLFSTNTTQRAGQQQQSSGRSGRGGFGGFGGFPGMPGGAAPTAGASEARQAQSRVVAVADEQSNSVILSAPDEVIPTIRQIITQIDTSIQDITDTKIFRLQHADAVELAGILNSLFADATTTNANNQNRRNGRGNGQQTGGGFPWFGGGQQQQGGAQSERALQQSKVVAVGDPRTNSLLVTAAQATMTQIAEMIGRLDATEAKKQRVYVHKMSHADAESVAGVLRGMLGEQTQQTTNRLTERSASGATMDTSDFSNQGGGGGARGR